MFRGLLALALGLSLLALLLALLSPLAPAPPDLKEVLRVIAIDAVTNNADALQPEGLERFLFTGGVFLLPFCLVAAHLVVRRLVPGLPAGALRRLETSSVWLVAAGAVGLLLSAGLAERAARANPPLPGGWYSLGAAAALAVIASWAGWGRIAARFQRLPLILSSVVVGSLLLGTLAISVFREEHIANEPRFWASFNPVFYSAVQVFLGRELTVDFINLYGLYPHFLEPVFRLVGLSVFSFTFLMGLLNCVAFLCLYLFLVRETRSLFLGTLGTMSVFLFSFASGRAVPEPDHYFQYHPLRMIFPALLLVAAQALVSRPRSWMPAALGALGAAACLWMTDVGVIVLASGILFLGYDSLAQGTARKVPGQLLQAGVAAAGVVLVFSLYLRLRYGAFPDLPRLFLYPKAFYLYGYAMLPMPRFGLWVPVLAAYALGLLRALSALVEREVRSRDKLYFLLSVLGIGLFSYYQGRSVLGNLAAASYPALLLICLFADDLRRSPAGSGLPQRVLLASLTAVLFVSVPAVAAVAPAWVRGVAANIETSRRGPATDVLRDARFLQGLLRPGEQVVIMSYHSGLFHLMTRTTNPLDIPGDSEMVYRRDFDKQSDYVLNRRGKAVVDRTTMSTQFVALIRGRFRDRIENPSGNLIFLPSVEASQPPHGWRGQGQGPRAATPHAR